MSALRLKPVEWRERWAGCSYEAFVGETQIGEVGGCAGWWIARTTLDLPHCRVRIEDTPPHTTAEAAKAEVEARVLAFVSLLVESPATVKDSLQVGAAAPINLCVAGGCHMLDGHEGGCCPSTGCDSSCAVNVATASADTGSR